jgi:hypothetical protein
VVDPDDHHLYTSLGCATENVVVAANAKGWDVNVELEDDSPPAIHIRLMPAPSAASTAPEVAVPGASPQACAASVSRASDLADVASLARAISLRQCTRAAFERRAIPKGELELLELAATGPGITPMFLTGTAELASVAEYVAQGNAAQLRDSKWREELVGWLRFNAKEARHAGDGLWSRALGSPEVPRSLARVILPLALTPSVQNRKDVPWIRGSAGVIVFVTERNDLRHWVDVGRCYERFALRATTLGIRNAFINQPVEVAALRGQFASWLGVGDRRPDLVVRFGYGPEMQRSLRRPMPDVIRGRASS